MSDVKRRAYKFRLYPTREQEQWFLQTFGACRFVWNQMLEDKVQHYRETGKMLRNTPAQYKDEYPWLRKTDSLALANVQLNLQSAFSKFFSDKRVGFPKFKSKRRDKSSYTTNNQNGTVKLLDGAVRLPKVGTVKVKAHRRPKEKEKLKSATVSMEKDGAFFISLLYEEETAEPSPLPIAEDSVLGMDYKSNGLYVSSDGVFCNMPRYFRKSQQRLDRQQRKLRNMKVGSKNREKQNRKIAKIYRHVANQRKDFLHKESAAIAKRYACVVVEDINMKAIGNKSFHNGKATMDNGFGLFCGFLDYKLRDRGGQLIRVDRWYPSSQLCSCCGARKKMQLKERVYECPVCGHVMDRDLNAAINIQREGLRMLSA